MKNGNKKKLKLNKSGILSIAFSLMFIISLIMSIHTFAASNPFKLNSVTISEKSSGVTGSISSYNDGEIKSDVTFHSLNDYAIFKIDLKNNLDKEITILEITDDNTNNYITYEYDKHENEKLGANGNLNLTIKATYKNELTDTSKRNQSNNFKLFIKYLDKDKENSGEIIINPKTNDGISASVIMLIISSIGLITTIFISKKKQINKLSKASMFFITGLLIMPIIVSAATISYAINLKININLYDKLVVTFDSGSSKETKTVSYGETVDSLPSATKTGYSFDKWINDDETEFDISKPIYEDVTVKALWNINEYTITFDTKGGSSIDPITQKYNTSITAPVNPTKGGFVFDGWEPELPNKMPAENITVTAKWKELDIICKRATTLSHEVCQISGSSNEGCRGDKYSYGDEIVYGSISLSNELSVGNALDCNVDGSGFNKRFYYIRTLNGKAVLIANTNFEGDSGEGYHNNYHYEEALTKLPRKQDQWTKVPVTFTHSGDDTVYAARFITIDDLKAMINSDDVTSHSVFNSPYNFIFENTSYANIADPEYRSTVWLEQDGTNRYRYHKQHRNVDPLTTSNYNSSVNSVRPVIEVPLDKIDISINTNEVLFVFDYKNGTSNEVRNYTKGSTINDLPEPTRDGYDFIGWYTDEAYENKFSNGSEANTSRILYAKWLVSNATVEYNNTGYLTFADAISNVKTTNEVTLKLLKDTSEYVSIPSNRNIKIDLNGHTMTNDGDNQVIYNLGTVTVANGTITTTALTKAAIDNNTNYSVTISNVTINANGNRSAIYNSKGTVNVNGGSTIIATNDLRPTIMNTSSSSILYVIDATIISNDKNAIDNNGGTVEIGSLDGNVNTSTPVIIGGSYAIASTSNVNLYDGVIKGKLAPAYNGKAKTSNNPITYTGGTVSNNIIIASEPGYIKTTGMDGDYHTLYLEAE